MIDSQFKWSRARVEVKAKSRTNFLKIISFEETSAQIDLIVHVTKPAINDQANTAVIEAIAQYFDLPKSSLNISKGKKSAIKWIECTHG